MDKVLVGLIQQLLQGRSTPELPDAFASDKEVVQLYNDLVHLRKILVTFSQGDFSDTISARGFFASTLKSLQAHLRHMVWQVQQVSAGDFSQRVEFMGDFSTAFNLMTCQMEELTKSLTMQATHDSLTGLANRYLLEDRLQQLVAQCCRNVSSFILVLLDLDGFKPVNDIYGHAAGDVLLIEFGQRIRSALRDIDTVSRFGGDEFVFIYECHRNHEREAAQVVMDRLYSLLQSQPAHLGNETWHTIQCSAGLAFFPSDADDMKQLFECADKALYESKRRGKNCYTLWDNIKPDRHPQKNKKPPVYCDDFISCREARPSKPTT